MLQLMVALPSTEKHFSHLNFALPIQVSLIQLNALGLHRQLAPKSVQPLHERLGELFIQMKSGMQKSHLMLGTGKRRTPSIINTPLPPVPRSTSTPKLERKDSRFSTNSNSLYGKFAGECLADDIYYKDPEFVDDNTNYYQDITAGYDIDTTTQHNDNTEEQAEENSKALQ